jgi:hypothetical protein
VRIQLQQHRAHGVVEAWRRRLDELSVTIRKALVLERMPSACFIVMKRAVRIAFLLLSAHGVFAQTPPASQSGVAPGATPAQTSPLSSSSSQLDFGTHDIGTTSNPKSVILNNSSASIVTVGTVSVSINPSEFVIANSCSKLNPGQQCAISVSFAAAEEKTVEGQLLVNYQAENSNSATGTLAVALVGIGYLPKLRITPTALDFGGQTLGSTSVVRTLTLTAGSASVNLKVSGPGGDFAATPDNCQQLSAGGSCSVSVTFTPKQLGASAGAITISTADGTIPAKVISLTAKGTVRCTPEQDVSYRDRAKALAPVLVVVFLYLLGLVFARWNMVALPTRALLRTQIDAVKNRIESLSTTGDPTPGLAHLVALLKSADDLIGPTGPLSATLDFCLWTRGQELAAWGYVHEVEEQLVLFLPQQSNQQENIRAALERAEADLRQLGTAVALAQAESIKQVLATSPPLPADRCRPVLQNLLKFFTPQTTTLAGEISQTLNSGATLTAEDYRELANKALLLLTPADTSLASQIEELLQQPNLSIDLAKPLLQQAAALLQPPSSALTQKLVQATSATTPLSSDDWATLLKEVQDYLIPESSKLVDSLNKALAADPVVPLDRWRALLSEALGLLYDRTDTDFATLVSWHNKTVWLVGTGLLLIVSLAAALQHEVLFLVGATGGLLSRLSRSLQRADVPTDYGASWTTLFLSPVVGALAGWSGVLLIVVAVELNVLGAVFKLDWCNPYAPLALGLAFLLGFSERAFDGILGQLEDKVQSQKTAPTASQATSLTIVVPSSFGDTKVGQAYDQQLTVSGGTSPYKWTVLSGSLPAGLSLDPTGRITGKATAAGQSKFTLQVADASGKATKSQEFTITVST